MRSSRFVEIDVELQAKTNIHRRFLVFFFLLSREDLLGGSSACPSPRDGIRLRPRHVPQEERRQDQGERAELSFFSPSSFDLSRLSLNVIPLSSSLSNQKISTTTAPFKLYAGVFDGHGGSAVSEWLTENLESFLVRRWPLAAGGSGSGGAGVAGPSPSVEAALTDAFLAADRKLLQPKAGFFGVGERGVGGSKCGSTAALVVLFDEGESTSLAAANVGDARAVLCRAGKALQLTTDHVPDSEEERLRIERLNPNPRLPLVRFVGGTWRVGGLLALSRAFGDSFMKGTG